VPVDVIGVLLEGERDVGVDYSSGFWLRGLFYRALRSVDEGLASRLHDYRALAPYSISPLMSLDLGIYFFRVTSYLTRLSDAALRAFESMGEFILRGVRFRPIEISLKRVDVERLWGEAKPLRRYELEFLTPTCFRRPSPYIPLHELGMLARFMIAVRRPKSHYRFHPLPDPILMLRNLKRQWDQYAGLHLAGRSFSRWLEDGGIAISGASEIRTHKLEDKRRGRFFIGFTGKVRLSLPEDTFSEKNARIVNALLRLGEESQVGINRTAGFGMYRITKAI